MADVIRWEEPPPHGNTGLRKSNPSRYQAAAEALRARPKQWALIREDVTTSVAGRLASDIRRGKPAPFAPAGAFEARSAGAVGSRSAKVYARFVGEVAR